MLFELLPHPMHIVITFHKPSNFYINVEESTTCHEHIWQSGRREVAAVYGNFTIEVQKKITPAALVSLQVGAARISTAAFCTFMHREWMNIER